MIISIEWLKELVSFEKSPKEIANDLTSIGLESTYNEGQDIIDIDNQIADEIKKGIIASPEAQDMENDSDNSNINIGDE